MATEPHGLLTRPDVSRGSNTPPPIWQDVVLRICEVLCPLTLGVSALALIVMLAMIATKHVDFPWLSQVNGTFSLLGGIGVLLLLIVNYRHIAWSFVALGVGIALNYTPIMLGFLCQQVGQDPQHTYVLSVGTTAQGLGTWVDIMAGVSLVYQFMLYFMRRDDRQHSHREVETHEESAAKLTGKPSLIPKCWEMSRCRPSIRRYCPNYASHTPCWKRRGGCLCDQGVANAMISSSGRGEAMEVIEMQQKANLNRGGASLTSGVRPSWSEQKYVCYSCPLFTEHQEYKFRYFNWLSLPITALIVWLAFNLFLTGYAITVNLINDNLHTSFLAAHDIDIIHRPFELIILGILSLLLWSGVVNMIERIFMRWKL